MATSESEQILNDWATAWSSHDTEMVLALFTENCVYEDVTFGAVNHGKAELRAFADGTFVAIPDFKVPVINRFVAGTGQAWSGLCLEHTKVTSPDCQPPASVFLRFGARRSSNYWRERSDDVLSTGTRQTL